MPEEIFGETADPHRYVPRETTERLLAALEERVVDEAGSALVSGPPGLGKSLVLHVLGERLSKSLSVLYLPYSALSPEDLCAFALQMLAEGGEPGADAESALRTAIRTRQARGSALLLLIDEARSLPLATARDLARLSHECAGGLRLVLAGPDDAPTSRVAAALDLDMDAFRLVQPLDRRETCEYVRARLRLAGAPPAVWRHFGRKTLHSLQRLSAGNPRNLHILAERVLADEHASDSLSHWDIAPSDLAESEGGAHHNPIDICPGDG